MTRELKIDSATVVLGIETSCDETAAALVMGGNDVLSSVVALRLEVKDSLKLADIRKFLAHKILG